MIKLDDVSLSFSPGTDFHFSFKVARGASLGVIGPSGAGKSTLLQMIAGFLVPERGSIVLDGSDHTRSEPFARPVSMVFQANNLFDHLNVAMNVGLGMDPAFSDRANGMGEAMEKVEEALASVGLAGFAGRRATELSGGEAQRVALARALVRDRPILLLDEPFAALGPSMRQELIQLLARMQQDRGLTMLTISHAPDELAGLCEELAFMDEGRIVARGPTRLMLDEPPSAALKHYLGRR
jgi:thiamine transport system ATP-binding protein